MLKRNKRSVLPDLNLTITLSKKKVLIKEDVSAKILSYDTLLHVVIHLIIL